jgi:hypothetical protein
MGGGDPILDVEELRDLVERLKEERDQLQHALESRIVIEQAKGVLAERYRLTIDDAFLLLRKSARSARRRIHEVAAEVLYSPQTPPVVLRGMARDSRLRAASIRERNEATAEAHTELQLEHGRQVERLGQHLDRPTARVRVTSRSDAVDLASRLSGYRWYLIVPDEEHWEVVVEFAGPPEELPNDLRDRIDGWLTARSIPSAHIRIAGTELELGAPPAPA